MKRCRSMTKNACMGIDVNNPRLKPCPCGQTPSRLLLEEGHTRKYAWVAGNCCGIWNVEFRTNYHDLQTEDAMKLAIAAWNDASREEIHPSISRMVGAMQEKLVANRHKDGWPKGPNGERGWMHDGCTIEFLIAKLDEEVAELKAATAGDGNVRLEAADVANIAMFLADKCGQKQT